MPECPKCGSKLGRIHRRPVDRFYSLINPIIRYRCRNIKCHWEGNMRDPSQTLTKKRQNIFLWAAILVGAIGFGLALGKILNK